jgi:uncharacterized protein
VSPDIDDRSAIAPPQAFGTWIIALVVGQLLLAGLVFVAFGVEGDDYSIAELGIATLAGWLAFVVAAAWASTRFGSGDLVRDYAIRFAPADLAGIVVGVAGQLVLVPALYIPLRELWPSTFSEARLEDRAQDLADKAGGFDTVLLALIVVIGAPLVEEVVYRGLLQRSVVPALGRGVGVVLVAAVFALVHLTPVEYPGLFVAGLLFGGCFALTGRLGTSIVAHAAFNATALVLVLR